MNYRKLALVKRIIIFPFSMILPIFMFPAIFFITDWENNDERKTTEDIIKAFLSVQSIKKSREQREKKEAEFSKKMKMDKNAEELNETNKFIIKT